MNIIDLGLMEYEKVWNMQKELVQQRFENKILDTLLLIEHPHVITKGRRGKDSDIKNSTVPVFEVERGGEVTYHGPGQLVGYPIFSLGPHSGVKQYMRSLEEVLIQTLETFDIQGLRKEGCTGVWVSCRHEADDLRRHPEQCEVAQRYDNEGSLKKIASIGVAVKKWVTYHGFALNVNTDLSFFQKIRPCGFDCSVMTSMKEIVHREVSLIEVKRALIQNMLSNMSSPWKSEKTFGARQ